MPCALFFLIFFFEIGIKKSGKYVLGKGFDYELFIIRNVQFFLSIFFIKKVCCFCWLSTFVGPRKNEKMPQWAVELLIQEGLFPSRNTELYEIMN